MDTTAETPKAVTYLKVPYNGGTIRSLPFEDKHLVALSMAQQMEDDQRKFRLICRTLLKLLGEAGYEQVTDDLVDGVVSANTLAELLTDIVHATKAYNDAASGTDG